MNSINNRFNFAEAVQDRGHLESVTGEAIAEDNCRAKLTVSNLNAFYGAKQALSGVNINVYNHKVTALIGPSGCGKTTFLRVLNRMNDLISSFHHNGEILLDGDNIYDPLQDVVKLRKRVGMVFQQPNPFPKSIYDNVAYGPRIHGVKKKTVLDGLVETSLKAAALWDEVSDRLHEPALSLSGGQQQRLCIARVLAVQPEVLLMDEPTSAIDPIATQRIEDLIRELCNTYTIVIVTHNMQQAARISDYTAFFLQGKLVEVDKTSKIFTKPSQRQTEEYVTGRFG